jgi:hypothetical protein
MCLAQEWNQQAGSGKTLRVTNQSGEQRSTYFLKLPYRWATPLTIMSGFLYWLLSQSLFLARVEIRDVNGNLVPSELKCTCGHSALSILVFSLTWICLLLIVLALLLRRMDQNLSLTKTCSLIISAASSFHRKMWIRNCAGWSGVLCEAVMEEILDIALLQAEK